jgi:hypothetical protein
MQQVIHLKGLAVILYFHACRDFMEMSPFGLNRNVPFGWCCCGSMGLNGDIEYESERTESLNGDGTSQT